MPRITPISSRKLGRVFERAGFRLVRQEGDHHVYVKEGTVRPVVIPISRDVPVWIIKNNLRTAGIVFQAFVGCLDCHSGWLSQTVAHSDRAADELLPIILPLAAG